MNSKEIIKNRVCYYHDELRDDFNELGLSRPPVPEGYKYKRTNPINNFFSAILYHGIAKPIIGLYWICYGCGFTESKNNRIL